jgi:hypothetical protein
MDMLEDLRDEIVAILRAAGPLRAGEIFEHSKLATDKKQIANVCYALRKARRITTTAGVHALRGHELARPASPVTKRHAEAPESPQAPRSLNNLRAGIDQKLDALEGRLQAPGRRVTEFELKRAVLDRLIAILDPEIGAVLASINEDLDTLEGG